MNLEELGMAAIPAISVICYLIGMIAKATPIDSKWIPVIVGVFGMMLGVAAMFVMPSFPAEDYITAIAIGIVSGLASTGIDQLIKQLSGNKKTDTVA